MRIATFNVQNLRLRHPGGAPRLDGARDADDLSDAGPDAPALDAADRRLTAAVLRAADADVVALQEVFDDATLDHFHDAMLTPSGCAPYPHRAALRGNDSRRIALMARRPFDALSSHAAETVESLGLAAPEGVDPAARVLVRDCVEADLGPLTLYACHLKAPGPDERAAWPVRRLEAQAIRRIVERRFGGAPEALWLILGDLNEPAAEPEGLGRAIAPLVDGFAVDLMLRLSPGERWTYLAPAGRGRARPDAMLASPALAARWPEARPEPIRLGLDAAAGGGPRLPGVGAHRPHASDHAALALDLPGL